MTSDVCFVNSTSPPLETKHICWYVSDSDDPDFIDLHEVVTEKYPHPDAPEDAFVFLTTTYFRKRVKRIDRYSAPLIVLKAAQETMSQSEHIVRK